MTVASSDRADRAAAALVKKPNGVFRVHYENGYPVAIAIGKVVVILLVEGDTRTMACVEPLVERLNGGIRLAKMIEDLGEVTAEWRQRRKV